MSGVSIELKNTLNLEPEEFEALVNDLVEELASKTPVKTGNARAGWHASMSKDGATIANDVDYVSFLEDGHSGQARQGMIKPSIKKYKPYVVSYDLGDPL